MTKRRLTPDDRRAEILAAALHVAKRDGYAIMSRESIAERAGCAANLVSHYFGTMTQLRRDIMRAAIRGSVVEIVAQGLAARDPHAMKAPDELRAAAGRYLTGGSA